ncbi:hypothetical protein MJD09_11225 [bacterium]|nr:hypothetical protein [bacterium]
MSNDYRKLLPVLVDGGVKFIVVGGVAAVVHGSAQATFDLDVIYARDRANIERLVNVLQPHSPFQRDAPADLPFKLDVPTVEQGLNFTLTTRLGDLDLLGEIVGGGGYEDLKPHSQKITVFDVTCLCLNLDRLIDVKRAAGRPKDYEVIAELEAIRTEKGGERAEAPN